ncbi:MAG: DUF3048 domain-containing protein [Ruthenibacterium sp.]
MLCCCVLLLGGAGCAVGTGAQMAGAGELLPVSTFAGAASQAALPPMTLPAAICPLTGLPLGAKGDVGVHSPRRPLAVMLDNVRVALPQRGVSDAAIVYEMVTESGITRLLAIYADYTKLPEVGPVRSARDAHVQMAIPLGAMLLHVGGSTYASDLLEIYHYGDKSVNGYYETGALQLDADRNATVAIEHCWFTNGALFSGAAESYGLSTELERPLPAFQFVPYAGAPRRLSGGMANRVDIRFSSYDSTSLAFNAATGLYEKEQFDAPQIDANTGKVLSFTNVLVLFADIGKYPDGVLAHVDLSGGTGYYLSGGRCEPVRWQKGLPEQPLCILAPDGGAYVEINPGTTYVAVVGLDKYKYLKIQ